MNRLDTIFSLFFMTFLMFLTWLITRLMVNKYGYGRDRHHHHGSVLPTTNGTTTGATGTGLTGTGNYVTRSHVHDYYSDYPWFLTAAIASVFLIGDNDALFGLTIVYTLIKLVGSFLHDNDNNMSMARRVMWYLCNLMILGLYINAFVGYHFQRTDPDPSRYQYLQDIEHSVNA
jgi:hypothetical protein